MSSGSLDTIAMVNPSLSSFSIHIEEFQIIIKINISCT
jgi:hypothetical protein